MEKETKRLDVFVMQRFSIARTQAAELIKDGFVQLDGNVCKKSGQKVGEKNCVELLKTPHTYVARSAQKLLGAKQQFDINFENKVVLDIGSSTGGFSEVCLQSNAKKVFCVDVGKDQLASKIREDSRVVCLEQTDIRVVQKEIMPDVDIVVCDVSFISLTLISAKIYELLNNGGNAYVLIKPQFECGKTEAKKCGGVVKNQKVREDCIAKVCKNFEQCGLKFVQIMQSVIDGGDGNVEFVAHFKK